MSEAYFSNGYISKKTEQGKYITDTIEIDIAELNTIDIEVEML